MTDYTDLIENLRDFPHNCCGYSKGFAPKDNCAVCEAADALAALWRENDAALARVKRLEDALRGALDYDGGVKYEREDDSVGNHACCGEISYKPHAHFCWVPKAKAALAEGDKP